MPSYMAVTVSSCSTARSHCEGTDKVLNQKTLEADVSLPCVSSVLPLFCHCKTCLKDVLFP